MRASPLPLLAVLVVTALGGVGAVARADEAADVAAALAASPRDAAAVARAAAGDDPDPWRVADALLARGADDVARAFAAATPRPATEGLAAYVASPAAVAATAARRSALVTARAALARGDAKAATDAATTARGGPDVVGVDAALVHAEATAAAGDLAAAVGAFRAAARDAGSIGWRHAASEALRQAARRSQQRGDATTMLEVADARVALETALGSAAGTARAEHQRAAALRALGRASDAEAALGRAEAAARAADDRESVGNVLGERAMLLAETGRTAEALTLLDAAASAYAGAATHFGEARFRPDAAKVERYLGQTQTNRAELLRALGRGADAEAALGEALASAVRGADRRREGAARSRLATLLEARGRRSEALAGRVAAVAAFDAAGALADAANERRLAATLRWALGDLRGAADDAARAVEALERVGAPRERAAALVEAGALADATGDVVAARRLLDAAVAAARAAKDRPTEARALVARARAAFSAGAFASAERDLEDGLAASQDAPAAARFEMELDAAALDARLGRLDVAVPRWRRLADEALARGDVEAAARARLGLVEAARLDGDLDAAAAALAGATDLAAGTSPAAALLALQRGDLDAAAGRLEEALAAHRAALARAETTAQPRVAVLGRLAVAGDLERLRRLDDAAREATAALAAAEGLGAADLEAHAATRVASVALARGDLDGTRAAARRALDATVAIGRGLADERGAGVRETVGRPALWGAEACLRVGALDEAFAFADGDRALALLESLGAAASLRAAVVPEALRRDEDAARAQEAVASAALAEATASGDRAAIRARRTALEAARARHADAVARIERDGKSRAGFVVPRRPTAAEVRAALGPDEAYVAFVASARGALALVLTRDGSRATAAVAPSEEEAGPPEDLASLGRMRERWAGALGLGAGVRRVVVCPDGAAADVPWTAVLADRDVAVVPSAGVWMRLAADRARTGQRVLAFGDPDYDGSARGTPRPSRWVRLPGTAAEARAVGDEVWLGGDATEASVRRHVAGAPRWAAVHFACHGLVDAARPLRSGLALAPDDDDDGLLTAFEVERLAVPADLVVLSGCETVRGRRVGAEGTMGLPRAFFVAGTVRVVASLWKVDDDATRALMTSFYRRWRAGSPTARALAEAQAEIAAQPRWSAPRYWAAWVLHGLPD